MTDKEVQELSQLSGSNRELEGLGKTRGAAQYLTNRLKAMGLSTSCRTRKAEWLVEWRRDGASGRSFVVGLSYRLYTAVRQLQSIQTEMEDQAGQQSWGAQKG